MTGPRRRKPGLIGLSVFAMLPVALYLGCKQQLELSFDDGTDAHTKARNAFLADLSDTACLRAEDILPVAKARDWDVRQHPDFNWCVQPATIQSWLRVSVEPRLPLSNDDENAEMFGFNANGCAVDWSYATGPGSTCPN